MIDPYPHMSLEYALKLLQLRFGVENVKRVQNGEVCVKVQYPGRADLIPVVLKPEQAKYLAVKPITPKDLADKVFPEDWPRW